MAKREKEYKEFDTEKYYDKVESKRASSKAISTLSKVGSRIGKLFTNPIKRSHSNGGNFNLFVFFVATLLLANFTRSLVAGFPVQELTFTGLLESLQNVPNVFDASYSNLGLVITTDWGALNYTRDLLNTMGTVIQTCWTFILLLYQLLITGSHIVETVFGLDFPTIMPLP